MRAAGEEGVTTMGYALMVAIIALLLIGGFLLLFNSVSAKLGSTSDCVSSPGSPECRTDSTATGP
jgi:Flp pilus assembly pilin Flp